jgi:hypothetical protein
MFPPGRGEPGHDHIDFEPHQLRRQFEKTACLSLVRSELEAYTLSLRVTQLAQRLPKNPPKFLRTGSIDHQDTNGWHVPPLRRRGERPKGRHAANHFEELAPSHPALPAIVLWLQPAARRATKQNDK